MVHRIPHRRLLIPWCVPVRASLAESDETIVSVYVNPAQFAPHEDFGSYPRTLPSDIEALLSLSPPESATTNAAARSKLVSAIFAPTTDQLYPNGIDRDKSKQRGAFVEVAGLQDRMEGASRPTFFRGVATVVTKLFNAVQVSQLTGASSTCPIAPHATNSL